MKRYEIINRFIQERGYENYLEIGVFNGECIRQIIAKNITGVDPGAEGQIAPEVTHRMTSDSFFESIENTGVKYDIIFIDGLHHSDQVDKDIINSLNYLIDGGVIVLHDCNPEEEVHTIVPRISGIWHGDVYKSILRFRKKGIHSVYTVNTDCGCGVIIKDNKIDKNNLSDDYDKAEYSWDYFFENKTKLLNLIDVEAFSKMKIK
jgi:hypothetical protein